ncbi:hypothetical protein [Chitinibacter tainanensis]|uniref:hypothetical protein n=1 Tax=Chitinibacter tainanensis TaxID=230667 RepID=UPI0003FD73B7|nr:hypothetical protein [Chitinibacter tainanensis]
MTKSINLTCALASLLAGAWLASPASAAPLQVHSTLQVGEQLSGPLRQFKQRQGRLQVQVDEQRMEVSPLPVRWAVAPQGLTATLARRAHPAGPQDWLTLEGQARDGQPQRWLLGRNLTSGVALNPQQQLVWRDGALQLSDGQGGLQALPADGVIGRQGQWRQCLQIVDLRVPAAETSDSEVTFDLLSWPTKQARCR